MSDTMKPASREGRCWAESLGGCDGSITREHLVTKALFARRARVRGGIYGERIAEISVDKLSANILCKRHNNELGRTADLAALKLFRHLQSTHKPTELPGSRIHRPPVDHRVSGVNFGRWLCKTHCNYMIAHGLTPDSSFVEHAFNQPSAKRIYFYFTGGVGDTLRLADSRDPVVSWTRLYSEDSQDDAFSLSLAGFESVVATAPVRRNGNPMLDRVRAVILSTPLGPFRILFDWSDQPQPD